jgi:hypothetical protein
VTHRRALRVVLALRADDLHDLLLARAEIHTLSPSAFRAGRKARRSRRPGFDVARFSG